MSLAALEIVGPVATLTLCRPEARNALSLELITALRARVDELARREDVTVLVMRGEGKAFCAGMDLKAVLDDPAAPGLLLGALAELTIALRALPMVSVAVVHGAAIGGGCGLSCVCDIALTHAESRMGFPEVDLGVCPAVVAPWLVRKIGPGRARRVLLMGGVMSGAEAHALGMVDQIAPTQADLAAMTDVLVRRLSQSSGPAVRETKRLLNRLDGEELAAQVRLGAEVSARVLASEATRATLRAKLGK